MMDKETKEKRRRELRQFAKYLLQQNSGFTAPIDPRIWIDNDEVRLKAINLNGECDGLIKFSNNVFYIFWDPSTGIRSRFSLTHEIAHYLIPEHRQIIMCGLGEHASKSDFQSEDEMESEADYLASQLLLPEDKMEFVKPEFQYILRAAEKLQVSVTACALRAVELSRSAVTLVMTHDGHVKWSWSSEESFEMGFNNLRLIRGKPPVESKTSELLKIFSRDTQAIPCSSKSLISSKKWFNSFRTVDFWEEALPLPHYKSILSILTYDP